ncbi:MAG: hypothetical protein ACPGVB_09030, partial [Chitinophagales bacterium]
YRDFDAKAYKEGHTLSKKNILWQEENISQKRQAGNIMRFPVLEDDGEILKLGVLGKIYNEYDLLETNSFNNVNNDINFFIQENNLLKINKLKSSKSIINVIFVVEGTKNMDIYHKAICNEVKRNSNLFRDNLNTFKFGGVVYCDNEIKGSIIQRKKPTTNIRSFTDFFGQEIKTYDEDENVGNSVNYGLYDALKTMGLKATETNVIVLVGREGNHVKSDKTQIEVDEIIQLMNGYNCQFFTFAADIPSDEYEELIYEARSFILGVAHIKHKYLLKNLPLFFEKNIFGATTKPRLFPKIDNKNAYFLKNTPITGEIYHAEYGEQISILDFQKNLKDLFLQVDSQTTKLLEIGLSPANWDEAKSELNPKNSGSSYNVQWKRLDFLLAAGLTENEIRKVWEVKEISSIGYAPKKIKHHSSPLFNYSILMTQKDLLNLYMKMRKVTHEYNRNTSIDEIQTELLFLHILTIAIRTGQTVEYLSNLSMDKIQNIRYKLPTNNGYPMCCRTDIDEIDLKHYMNYLDQKIRQLENIINGFNYPYSFTKNDITYYWISEDFLP